MTVTQAVPKLILLAFFFLASGCQSQLQKSLNRSVMIAERCADIEEAVPLKDKELELALVNAISVRLLSKCVDGSQQCLGPAASTTAVPDPLASAQELTQNLRKHSKQLALLNKQFVQTNRETVKSLQGKYEMLEAKLVDANSDASSALAALQTELENAKATLGSTLSDARTCQRRTNCVAVLAQRLVSIRPQIEGKINALYERMQRLNELAQSGVLLNEQAKSFIDMVPMTLALTADAQQQIITEASEQLTRDTIRLAASSTFFMQRLQTGARALESLFSAEVQEAATAFMAAKLYDKTADRTLAAIDRMLAQLDRTIDQVDEHAYGAATIGTYLFQTEMQDKLDQVFKTLVADRFPNNNTAKLAFAAAACRRLAPEDDKGIKNASMFSPFVFAALIHIEGDLRKMSTESVRKDWEGSLEKPASPPQAANPKTAPEFIELVAAAYHMDSSGNEGRKPIAPSMLQQVALCANVEQELASTQQLNREELLKQTRSACGKAVVAATMMGEALPNASSPALARLVIEKARPGISTTGPSGQPDLEDAAAWQRAMEAVLAAAVPRHPLPLDLLCQRIKSAITAAHCDTGETGSAVTLHFNSSFVSGKAYDRTLEMHMARLADVLSDGKQAYIFKVHGYASASRSPCSRSASGTPMLCGGEKNFALAQARANWAMDVLRKRLGERIAAESIAIGQFNPLSFDTPADRRIRVTISLRN